MHDNDESMMMILRKFHGNFHDPSSKDSRHRNLLFTRKFFNLTSDLMSEKVRDEWITEMSYMKFFIKKRI